MDQLPDKIDFPGEEKKILVLWDRIEAFQTSLKQSRHRPRFTFYDGPPFATGLPHYGHLLAGTIKDIITRFSHQSGFHVERRFGWDCHGLPIEYEIDKTLGIKSPEDVARMGIDKYNSECRNIVMRYSSEWRKTVARLGRWIDFDRDYKTMYPWFMESVWWVFKQLYNKGLVYKGVKVMPYSTTCNTPLSNFEAGQNYKEVVDPAVVVSFPLDDDPSISLVAWTTTPWTLPSNLALCVNPDLAYVKVRECSTGAVYVLMESRLSQLFKQEAEYRLLEKFKGQCLKGKKYQPLLPYFSDLKQKGAFCILCDTYVTEESGTGVVHQAPFFGEDDYRVCLANGVITKDQEAVCPLDASGCFVEPVSDFLGVYVKDADKLIINHLKKVGRLVQAGTTKHNYPFCWRSDTPLIYRAVPSWFVRVEHMNHKLLESNANTYWVPEFIKEKRFGNWLRDARDWAISRNRYWGTPIPLWISEDGEELVCVGSIEELERLSGQKVADLHRDFVDDIELPSRLNKGKLRRIPEVFDCWFESGSMPYAQQHYPFENRKEFDDMFPADFIAEGVDQTRGWFYTMIVLSTALFGKPPFKNLICNGLVLASDGQKMSKRKKNYPDPMDIMNKFGADALRLYLINSPAVRAENLRFKEEGVRDILKDVFLPWYNAFRFLLQNIALFERTNGTEFKYEEPKVVSNIMDKWILSYTNSLISFVKREMGAYRLYTVVPRLVKYIDNLTNWYVRMNRRRLKGDVGTADCRESLNTLFSVLHALIRLMASFTPFIAEFMYQKQKALLSVDERKDSVHYLMLPQVNVSLIDQVVERMVARMQSVIELGRVLRDRKALPLKYPLSELVVIQNTDEYLSDLNMMEQYILDELNLRKIVLSKDKGSFGVSIRAEPDIKALGLRLKGKSKEINNAIRALSEADLQSYLKGDKFELCGVDILQGEIRVQYVFSGKNLNKYEAHSEGDVLVLLDVEPDQSLLNEGLAREIVNRIQKMRKKAQLIPTDPVVVFATSDRRGTDVEKVLASYGDYIKNLLKAPFNVGEFDKNFDLIEQEIQDLKGAKLTISIGLPRGVKRIMEVQHVESCVNKSMKFEASKAIQISEHINIEKNGRKVTIVIENPLGSTSLSLNEAWDLCVFLLGTPLTNPTPSKAKPFCKYVNIAFNGMYATVLLENPVGENIVDISRLSNLIRSVFSVPSVQKIVVFVDSEYKTPLNEELFALSCGKTLYAALV